MRRLEINVLHLLLVKIRRLIADGFYFDGKPDRDGLQRSISEYRDNGNSNQNQYNIGDSGREHIRVNLIDECPLSFLGNQQLFLNQFIDRASHHNLLEYAHAVQIQRLQ